LAVRSKAEVEVTEVYDIRTCCYLWTNFTQGDAVRESKQIWRCSFIMFGFVLGAKSSFCYR